MSIGFTMDDIHVAVLPVITDSFNHLQIGLINAIIRRFPGSYEILNHCIDTLKQLSGFHDIAIQGSKREFETTSVDPFVVTENRHAKLELGSAEIGKKTRADVAM